MIFSYTQRSWLPEIPTIIRTFSPGLKNNNTLKCSSNNFPGMTHICQHVWKIAGNTFQCMFSNPGEKVLFIVESQGQIYPLAFILFRT